MYIQSIHKLEFVQCLARLPIIHSIPQIPVVEENGRDWSLQAQAHSNKCSFISYPPLSCLYVGSNTED